MSTKKKGKKGDCAKAARDLATKHSPAAGRRLAACKLGDGDLACKVAGWRLSVLGSHRAGKVLAGCAMERRSNPGMRGVCNESIPGDGLTMGGRSIPACGKRATCDRVGPDGHVHGYCGEHGKGKPKPPAGWGKLKTRENPGRSLRVIAGEIRRDWKDPYYGAEPYIRAMADLDSVDAYYGDDRGSDIVLRFLANAGKWRGAKAKEIKNELRAMAGLRVVKNPGCGCGVGDDEFEPELFDGDGLIECPMCAGPAGSMGTLGRLEHCQCRHCGWEFVRDDSAPVEILAIGTVGNPGGVDPRLRREGTLVEFVGYPAGYSRAPASGERGRTVKLPAPGGRSVFMPGPGGGLIYVDWERIGTSGIAPQDLKVISVAPTPKAAAPQSTAASTRQEYDRARYELEVFHLNSVAEMRAVERAVSQGAYSVADEEGMSVRFRYASMEGLRAAYGRLMRGIRSAGWRISWGAYDLRTHQSVLREIEEPATRGNPSVREGSGVQELHTRRGSAPASARRGRPQERPIDLVQNEMRNLADRENLEEGRFYSGDEWSRRHGSARGAAMVWVQEYIAGAVDLWEGRGNRLEEQIQKAARPHGYYMEPVNAEVMAFYPISAGSQATPSASVDVRRLRSELQEYLGGQVRPSRDRAFFTGEQWMEEGRDRAVRDAVLVLVDSYVAGAMSGDSSYGLELQDTLAEIAERHGAVMEVVSPETVAFYANRSRGPARANNPGRTARPWQQLYDRDGDRFTLANGTKVSVQRGRDEDVGDQSFVVAVPRRLWDRNEFAAMRELERALGPLSEKREWLEEHEMGRDGSVVFHVYESLGGKRHWA